MSLHMLQPGELQGMMQGGGNLMEMLMQAMQRDMEPPETFQILAFDKETINGYKHFKLSVADTALPEDQRIVGTSGVFFDPNYFPTIDEDWKELVGKRGDYPVNYLKEKVTAMRQGKNAKDLRQEVLDNPGIVTECFYYANEHAGKDTKILLFMFSNSAGLNIEAAPDFFERYPMATLLGHSFAELDVIREDEQHLIEEMRRPKPMEDATLMEGCYGITATSSGNRFYVLSKEGSYPIPMTPEFFNGKRVDEVAELYIKYLTDKFGEDESVFDKLSQDRDNDPSIIVDLVMFIPHQGSLYLFYTNGANSRYELPDDAEPFLTLPLYIGSNVNQITTLLQEAQDRWVASKQCGGNCEHTQHQEAVAAQ